MSTLSRILAEREEAAKKAATKKKKAAAKKIGRASCRERV